MAENETNTITHEHILRLTGDADFSGLNAQFKNMIKDLDAVTKSSAKISKGFKELSGVKKNFMDLAGSIAGLTGATVGLKEGLNVFTSYNKELLKLSSQFAKYNIGINQVEKSVIKLSKELSFTRTETIKLFSLYEKGFPYTSLIGAEKLFKNIRNAVGTNTEAVNEMFQSLQSLTNQFPELQKLMQNINDLESNKEGLKQKALMLVLSKKISLTQYKGLMDFVKQNKQRTKQEEDQKNLMDEYSKTVKDMERIWQEISITIGKTIIPYFQMLKNTFKEYEVYIKSFAGFLSKWGTVLVALAGVAKVGQIGAGVFKGLSSLFGGVFKRGTPTNPMHVYVSNQQGSAGGMAGKGRMIAGAGLALAGTAGYGLASHLGGRAGANIKVASGAAMGASVGMAAGPWGAAIGALVGAGMELYNSAQAIIDAEKQKQGDLKKDIRDSRKENAKIAMAMAVRGYEYKAPFKDSNIEKMSQEEKVSLYKKTTKEQSGIKDAAKQLSEAYLKQWEKAAQGTGPAAANAKTALSRWRPALTKGTEKEKEEARLKLYGYTKHEYMKKEIKEKGGSSHRLSYMKGMSSQEAQTSMVSAFEEGEDQRAALMGNILATYTETDVILGSIQSKKQELVSLTEAQNQAMLQSSETPAKQKEFISNLEARRNVIKQQNSLLNQQIKDTKMLVNVAKEGGDKAAEAEYTRQIATYEKEKLSLVKESADIERAGVDRAGAKAALSAQEAQSRAAVLSSMIEQSKITGKIDPAKELKTYQEVITKLKSSRADAGKEVIEAERELQRVLKENAGDQNLKIDREDILNKAVKKEKDFAQQIQAVNEAHIDQYSTKQQLAEAMTASAKIEVSLMDNLVAGLGASVQARNKAAASIEKQILIQQKVIDAIDAMGEEERKNEKNVLKRQQAENNIKNLMQDQAGILKSIRDGWVSSINAMTIGTGRISKLTISSNENMRQGLQYVGMIRSATSGAVQRAGERNIGFKTPERLRAEAGGTVSIENGRGMEQSYTRDTDNVTNTQAELLRMRREAKKGAGTATGVEGSGPGASPALTRGLGKGGKGTQTGNMLPGDVAARNRVQGQGAMPGSGVPTNTKTATSGNAQFNINMSFTVGSPGEAVRIFGRELLKIWPGGKAQAP